MSKVEAIKMLVENIDTIIDVLKDKVEIEHNCATPVADDDEPHYLCEDIVQKWEGIPYGIKEVRLDESTGTVVIEMKDGEILEMHRSHAFEMIQMIQKTMELKKHTPHVSQTYRENLITEEGGWMQFVGFCFLAGDQLGWEAEQIAEYVVETYHGMSIEAGEVPKTYADTLADMTKYAEGWKLVEALK